MATLEGLVRQSTENELEKFEVKMLTTGESLTAYSVTHAGDSVKIETSEGQIPIFSLKLDQNLLKLLTRDLEVWDV